MTPTRFRNIRFTLGLSVNELARVLRLESGRTIRRYEGGQSAISGPVSLLMELLEKQGLSAISTLYKT